MYAARSFLFVGRFESVKELMYYHRSMYIQESNTLLLLRSSTLHDVESLAIHMRKHAVPRYVHVGRKLNDVAQPATTSSSSSSAQKTDAARQSNGNILQLRQQPPLILGAIHDGHLKRTHCDVRVIALPTRTAVRPTNTSIVFMSRTSRSA